MPWATRYTATTTPSTTTLPTTRRVCLGAAQGWELCKHSRVVLGPGPRPRTFFWQVYGSHTIVQYDADRNVVIGDYNLLQTNSRDNVVRGKKNVLRNSALRNIIIGEYEVIEEGASDNEVSAPCAPANIHVLIFRFRFSGARQPEPGPKRGGARDNHGQQECRRGRSQRHPSRRILQHD